MPKFREIVLSTLFIGLICLLANQAYALTLSVRENQPRDTVVGTVTITDNNGRYSLGGADLNHFGINSESGQLTTSKVFDYEGRKSYSVTVIRMVYSPVQVAAKSVRINITNDPSDDATTPPPKPKPTLKPATTPPPKPKPTLKPATTPTPKPATTPPPKPKPTPTPKPATQPSTNPTPQVISEAPEPQKVERAPQPQTVGDRAPQPQTIQEVPEPQEVVEERTPQPQMAGDPPLMFTVLENRLIGTNVGTPVRISDLTGIPTQYATQSYYMMWGADSVAFEIERSNGQLKTAEVLDFETKSEYEVFIARGYVTSTGEPYHTDAMKTVIITVVDRPEPPMSSVRVPSYPDRPYITNSYNVNVIYGEISENTTPRSVTVGFAGLSQALRLSTRNKVYYPLAGPDGNAFEFIRSGNNLNLIPTQVFDYETKQRYHVAVIAQSTTGAQSVSIVDVIIDIKDDTSDNAPTRNHPDVATFSITENNIIGKHIGRVTSTRSGVWGLGGPDLNAFYITGDGTIAARKVFDYEEKNRYKLIVYKGPKTSPAAVKNVIVNVLDERKITTWNAGDMIADFPDTRGYTWGSYLGDTRTIGGVVYHCDPKGNPPTCYILNKEVKRGDVQYIVDPEAAPGAPMALAWDDVKRGLIRSQFADDMPKKTELLANYPNPFNPETWIPYHLAHDADVTLTIYSTRGAVVRRFELGHQPAGFYTTRAQATYWDGRNDIGEPVASGVYFYHLSAGDYSKTRQLVILK